MGLSGRALGYTRFVSLILQKMFEGKFGIHVRRNLRR